MKHQLTTKSTPENKPLYWCLQCHQFVPRGDLGKDCSGLPATNDHDECVTPVESAPPGQPESADTLRIDVGKIDASMITAAKIDGTLGMLVLRAMPGMLSCPYIPLTHKEDFDD